MRALPRQQLYINCIPRTNREVHLRPRLFSRGAANSYSGHAAPSRSLLADVPGVIENSFSAGSELDLDEPIERHHAVPRDLCVVPRIKSDESTKIVV